MLTTAWGQAIPDIGSRRVDPSVLQNQELQRREPEAQPYGEEKEKPEVDTQQAAPEPDSAGPVDEGPRLLLKEILITGVTVFESPMLEEKFTPWIDREVGYKELLQITADVTNLYKEHGYITSRAVLPPQEIENGSVAIHVIEGRIGEIKIEGNKHVRDGYIARRIKQKPGEVFRLQTLQKSMLNLSEDSLLDKAHATLKTGSRPGTSDLVLDIDDHQPIHLMVSVDNMGRNGIGLWRNSYTLSHENVLGFGDSAMLSTVLARHTVAAVGQYRFPLTTNGWGVGGNYSFTHVDAGETQGPVLIDDSFEIRTITGDSHRFSAFTDFPIYRSPVSRRWNVSGNVSLNFIDSMTYLDGFSLKDVEYKLKKRFPAAQVSKHPSIRTISSRVQAVEQDRTGRWLMGGSMTNAFAAMGGNEAFVKFNADMTRVQALPWGMIGMLRAEGQFTPDRLPFAEKMQLGGANSVRGYPEGYLIADAGYLFSAEIRYPLIFLPKKIRNDWQGLIFVDHGQLFACGNNDVKNTEGTPGSLLGYGVGIRGKLTKYLNARLDLGMATNHASRHPDLRAHFMINSQLF